MTTVLQVSDPHFGTEVPAVVDALQALAERERPEVAIWSGDITQRARAAQWAAATRVARQLGAAHTLALPGNHDIALFNLAARLFRPYAGFARAFGSDLAPVLSLPDLLVLGVNTTRRWRHKHGEVSDAQIDAVAARLAQATPQQWRVVVTHQPMDALRAEDRVHVVRGAPRALARWAEAGCDLVLGGHIHLPWLSTHRAASRAVGILQAGTAVSRRTRRDVPNSVNLLRVAARPTPLTIERWDYVDHRGGQRFALAEQAHWSPR
jgi:3',5'-cyclic AMP phosphodiesterase CpdA